MLVLMNSTATNYGTLILRNLSIFLTVLSQDSPNHPRNNFLHKFILSYLIIHDMARTITKNSICVMNWWDYYKA